MRIECEELKNFCTRIFNDIIQQKRTQLEISQVLDIKQSSLSMFLAGLRTLHAEKVSALLDYLRYTKKEKRIILTEYLYIKNKLFNVYKELDIENKLK